jgi:hypothetical protein
VVIYSKKQTVSSFNKRITIKAAKANYNGQKKTGNDFFYILKVAVAAGLSKWLQKGAEKSKIKSCLLCRTSLFLPSAFEKRHSWQRNSSSKKKKKSFEKSAEKFGAIKILIIFAPPKQTVLKNGWKNDLLCKKENRKKTEKIWNKIWQFEKGAYFCTPNQMGGFRKGQKIFESLEVITRSTLLI